MRTGLAILLVGLGAAGAAAAQGLTADGGDQPLLQDGFLAKGIDGILVEQQGRWWFQLAVDVNDGFNAVEAGSRLRMLPSASLERIVADSGRRSDAGFRLWARVTRYRESNYLFAVYHLALSKAAVYEPVSAEPAEPKPRALPQDIAGPGDIPASPPPKAAEPNGISDAQLRETFRVPVAGSGDILDIPQEVLDRIRTRPAIQAIPSGPVVEPNQASEPNGAAEPGIAVVPGVVVEPNAAPDANESVTSEAVAEAVEGLPAFKQDIVMLDWAGFVRDTEPGTLDQGYAAVFQPDGYGFGIQQQTYRLLPCAGLELAQGRRGADPNRTRFKIAGVVTEYDGHKYMLLQQAVRVYSYGNFSR